MSLFDNNKEYSKIIINGKEYNKIIRNGITYILGTSDVLSPDFVLSNTIFDITFHTAPESLGSVTDHAGLLLTDAIYPPEDRRINGPIASISAGSVDFTNGSTALYIQYFYASTRQLTIRKTGGPSLSALVTGENHTKSLYLKVDDSEIYKLIPASDDSNSSNVVTFDIPSAVNLLLQEVLGFSASENNVYGDIRLQIADSTE